MTFWEVKGQMNVVEFPQDDCFWQHFFPSNIFQRENLELVVHALDLKIMTAYHHKTTTSKVLQFWPASDSRNIDLQSKILSRNKNRIMFTNTYLLPRVID